MNLALRPSVLVLTASLLCFGALGALPGCGDGKETKTAKVASGPMPEGQEWRGVYYHPIFGELHLVEEGQSIIGRWKRTDKSHWGELSGVRTGNVVHYQWKEHQIGLVGPSATTHGKGYFVYKMNKEGIAELDGQFGLNDDEVGSDWHNVKQMTKTPDLKSIGGDSEGINPGGF